MKTAQAETQHSKSTGYPYSATDDPFPQGFNLDSLGAKLVTSSPSGPVGVMRSLKPKQSICPAETGEVFVAFILLEGQAIQTRTSGGGKDGPAFLLFKNDVFGDWTGLQSFQGKATALTPSRVLSLTWEDVSMIPVALPHLYQQILTDMSRRIRELEHWQLSLARRSTADRIHHFMNWLVQKAGQPTQEGNIRIANHLTHKKIASIIGVSRQSVTTWFNRLQERRILRYSRTEIIIFSQNETCNNPG